MHVHKRSDGEEAAPDETRPEQEAGGSTNIHTFGRLYHTIPLTHGHVVSLSVLIKKGALKKASSVLSNKPLMQTVLFTKLFTADILESTWKFYLLHLPHNVGGLIIVKCN